MAPLIVRATLIPGITLNGPKVAKFKAWAYRNSVGLLENEAHSHRLGKIKNFTPKLENLPSHFPRTFHGLLRKRMKAKNGLGCFLNRGLSCPDRIKLSDHEIKLKGMPSKHLWSHLARRNFSKEIEQTGAQKIVKLK